MITNRIFGLELPITRPPERWCRLEDGCLRRSHFVYVTTTISTVARYFVLCNSYRLYICMYLLVCVWEDQRESQYYICHKISSILYGKYSTVISKYSTIILIYHVVNNPLDKYACLCLFLTLLKWIYNVWKVISVKSLLYIINLVMNKLIYSNI